MGNKPRNTPRVEMSSSGDLAALANRIDLLEERLGGRAGMQPVLGSLAELSTDLGNSLAGNDRVEPLLRRTQELETFLDPLFGETGMRGEGVRWSIVESQGDRLNKDLEMLNRVEKLKGGMEGGRGAQMDSLKPRLATLSQVQVEQREEGEALTKECLDLVQQYNQIIASLTEAFIQADQAVTKAEMEAGLKAGD